MENLKPTYIKGHIIKSCYSCEFKRFRKKCTLLPKATLNFKVKRHPDCPLLNYKKDVIYIPENCRTCYFLGEVKTYENNKNFIVYYCKKDIAGRGIWELDTIQEWCDLDNIKLELVRGK